MKIDGPHWGSSQCSPPDLLVGWGGGHQSDNLPSYLQTNTIAQMLFIRGEGATVKQYHMSKPTYSNNLSMVQQQISLQGRKTA